MHDLEVPAALEGERLDRTLALVTGLTRREINEVIDAGRVRVGRRSVTSRSRRVHAGEKLSVEGPLERAPEELVPDPTVVFGVVHADPQLVVVDKPAGLVVHPGAGQRAATLVHGLLARFPDLAGVGGDPDRPGIVHRLDKGTSGLLAVARTEAAREHLVGQLSTRTMGREYDALVAGTVESEAGVVDAPLGRSDTDPTRIRVQAGGRPARTRYEVVDRYDEPVAATLLRCHLETGRTHQIRVHLASIGHPVLGDERYGSRTVDGLLPPGRPFLHAGRLSLEHPSDERPLSFTSDMPEDLLSVRTRMRRRG